MLEDIVADNGRTTKSRPNIVNMNRQLMIDRPSYRKMESDGMCIVRLGLGMEEEIKTEETRH